LETSQKAFAVNCLLNRPTYWKSRVLGIFDANAEADITNTADSV
jgi:hypothetical protein